MWWVKRSYSWTNGTWTSLPIDSVNKICSVVTSFPSVDLSSYCCEFQNKIQIKNSTLLVQLPQRQLWLQPLLHRLLQHWNQLLFNLRHQSLNLQRSRQLSLQPFQIQMMIVEFPIGLNGPHFRCVQQLVVAELKSSHVYVQLKVHVQDLLLRRVSYFKLFFKRLIAP